MTAVQEFPRHKGTSTQASDVAARVVSDRAEGEAYVASICFKHGPPRLLGVELEYTVHDTNDPRLPLDPARLIGALGPHTPHTLLPESPALPLPAGTPLSLEPGGQVEISALPQPSLAELDRVVSADLRYLTELLASAGLRLGNYGMDAFRADVRLLGTERYAAMQRRFAKQGVHGLAMMCATAGLQVCVDTGERAELPGRWAAAHALGPVLLAMFANSRWHAGRDTGCASGRWRAMMRTERARTFSTGAVRNPPSAWAARVMDTPLMVVPRAHKSWDAPDGLTFADWVAGRGAAESLEPPTTRDLDYHLGTMFTPVRPQGYLELRYLDSQPPGAWLPPVALLASLLGQPSTVDRVREICAGVADRWWRAARYGLSDPGIASAAREVADLGCARLSTLDLSATSVDMVAETVQRRVRSRRK